MNESCVPKCLNLWKTYQDISLSPFSKNNMIWLWIENVFVSILGSPTWFSVSLVPTLPLQEMKFPFSPWGQPWPHCCCHLLPCKTSKGGGQGKSVHNNVVVVVWATTWPKTMNNYSHTTSSCSSSSGEVWKIYIYIYILVVKPIPYD
jgi:hypothetical protein